MNELTIFNFSENEIRVVIGENGESWFVAADVCRVLEIKNPTDALNRLDDDEKQVIDFTALANTEGVINQQLNNGQKINIINESGLYSLVLTSRKPEAKAFKKWVTSEVLPGIRKTGSYAIPQNYSEALKLAYEQSLVIEDQSRRIAENDSLIRASNEASIKADEILVREFVKSVDIIDLGEKQSLATTPSLHNRTVGLNI